VPGAFDASAEFDHDPLATADEIQHGGEEALRWLKAVATSASPRPVDLQLVKEIHFRWAVADACESWHWRRDRYRPSDEVELIEFIVAEANTLAVRIYDVHPFIDGNTRATWHLRNYVFMLDSLRPLIGLTDLDEYEKAWWNARAEDHRLLDDIVLTELASQQPPN
jgi:hypothetical protein